MSRAFTREEDSENAIAGVGERPISTHRNLVTERGLAQIDDNLADLRDIMAKAERKADRERIAVVSRDLRYWTARRESAELSVPEPGSDVVRFGMGVTLQSDDGRKVHWKIVGEDEADPAKGSISHVSPMAVALFGKKVGDVASVNGKEWEIVKLSES
ncbi:transcription elongation factor GreA [Mesorhizobium sp. ESP6-5]|uniref:Transcription elongation factor n=1 Tax=Mesorhizobium australicum (strain HAMBI 3006 / LMG 24608 / WSM2073) TaxID=754035 RepID=L0KTH8_MESAW|nr:MULTISPECIES: transcription elongation factor GreA [Mesorhizobium]MBZ9929637.1 transcription elongation factor GreA [Mesorhizobium sp. BR1-1-5]AGB47289.1 transcription elongation factor [Mesorhizobium australicum WSM2073]MBZ9694792.1 transcription elongation factor GreA [Mesorhizobium sp. CO1-1-9]MBZ9724429.1 transcription elongation factor GreA [Mesorhizobium sp. CO1-1-11]MBZ9755740.1 transcription elongation factor GreA [Mesorhizobium sp. ESP6-5]